MNFGTIMQALEAKQSKTEEEFTMDDLLGLVVDLFDDVDRSFKESGVQDVAKVEDIKVDDEKRFMRNLCKLAISFGRIYHNNLDYFSEDNMTAIRRKAVDSLTEIEQRASLLDGQIKAAESMERELTKSNEALEKKLNKMKTLNQQLEQLEGLKCTYEDKLEKSRTIQEEIDDYSSNQIPKLENEIKQYELQFYEINKSYSELCDSYNEEIDRINSVRDEYEAKRLEKEQIAADGEELRQQINAIRLRKDELVEANEKLSSDIEQLETDIQELNQQQQDINRQIDIINDNKITLEGKIRELRAEQGYLETENYRVQSDYDRVKKEHADMKYEAEHWEERRKELMKETESYKDQCVSEQYMITGYEKEIVSLKQQYETIKKKQEDSRKEIAEQKKRTEEAKIDFFIYKVNLERLIRNSQIQQEALGRKQVQIATQIKTLLDDDVINESWMYSMDDLRKTLEDRREKINDQIKREMKLFESALIKLEDDIYGGV